MKVVSPLTTRIWVVFSIPARRPSCSNSRINWWSLLETITVRFWSISTEKHAQRGEKNLNHLYWTSTGRVCWEWKKFGNHSNRSVKHDQIADRRIPWVPVLVVFFFNSDSSNWKFLKLMRRTDLKPQNNFNFSAFCLFVSTWWGF